MHRLPTGSGVGPSPPDPVKDIIPSTTVCQVILYVILSIRDSILTTEPDLIWAVKSPNAGAEKALPENMLKNSYEVEVLINGKAVKEYAHEGKIYVEGREGTPFSIRIHNNAYSRKLFVPTIDGLSVVDGKEGDFKSSGYIVKGYSSITIDGWRTSDKDVATFYFSSPEESYRKRVKLGNNLGVIGVAVFAEVTNWTSPPTVPWTVPIAPHYPHPITPQYPPYPYPVYPVWYTTGTAKNNLSNITQTTEAMCCSKQIRSVQTQKLGTGWGEQKHSEVTTVNFERNGTPEVTFEIYYNTRQELENAGINFKKEPLYMTPQAFPGQYCIPPSN